MNKIFGFDGVRAVAVMFVVLDHLHIFRRIQDEHVQSWFSGMRGVQIFFVLSGFLITWLLQKEFSATGKISFKNFYIRRALRILPLYIASLLFITFMAAFEFCRIKKGHALMYAYLYIYNFLPKGQSSSLLVYSWTLAVEEHFYLLWPVIFAFFLRRNPKRILFWLPIAFVASNIFFNIMLRLGMNDHFHTFRWTPISGSNIMVGCFMATLLMQSQKAREILRMPVFLALGILFYSQTALGEMPFKMSAYFVALGIGLVLGWIFLNQKSLLVRILEFKPIQFIGMISYGIYIFQGIVLSSGPERNHAYPWPPDPKLAILLIAAIAPMSYYFFERRFLKLKDRFSN